MTGVTVGFAANAHIIGGNLTNQLNHKHECQALTSTQQWSTKSQIKLKMDIEPTLDVEVDIKSETCHTQ